MGRVVRAVAQGAIVGVAVRKLVLALVGADRAPLALLGIGRVDVAALAQPLAGPLAVGSCIAPVHAGHRPRGSGISPGRRVRRMVPDLAGQRDTRLDSQGGGRDNLTGLHSTAGPGAVFFKHETLRVLAVVQSPEISFTLPQSLPLVVSLPAVSEVELLNHKGREIFLSPSGRGIRRRASAERSACRQTLQPRA